MILIDSHCHLDGAKFEADRDDVIARATAAGVRLMLTIGSGEGPPHLDVAVQLAGRYDTVFATVGVHPHDARLWNADCIPHLHSLLLHPKVLGVGEIGLDYHYDFSPAATQREVFTEQLHFAGENAKPIIIHTREAWPDTFALLEQHWAPYGLPGIFHCFSGGPAEAERCLQLGFYLSFAGTVTFPKALDLHDAARTVPADRFLIETDSPFLAPIPYRGKRNEPSLVQYTAARVAELRGVSVEQIATQTTQNFVTLFPQTASALQAEGMD